MSTMDPSGRPIYGPPAEPLRRLPLPEAAPPGGRVDRTMRVTQKEVAERGMRSRGGTASRPRA